MLPALIGTIGGGILQVLKSREARKTAAAVATGGGGAILGSGAVEAFTSTSPPQTETEGTRYRRDPETGELVPIKRRRRRRRAMTASDKADFAFLRSQGVGAKDAAGLIMAGVGRTR